MKKVLVLILMFVFITAFSAQENTTQKPMFVEKGNRAISYVGFVRIQEDEKNGLNLGGEYLWHIAEDFFVGVNFDYSLFFYTFGNSRETSSLSNLSIEGSLELHNTLNYSFEVLLGLGANFVNIAGMDNMKEVFTLGARYNYKKFSFALRYNLIGVSEDNFLQTFGLSFGFLLDMRPKVLNKGYYNDEF